MKYAPILLILVAAPAAAREAPTETAAWGACLKTRGAVFAAQSEPAPTVADAALGACASEENALIAQLQSTPALERMLAGPRSMNRDYREGFDREFAAERSQAREALIAATMNWRAGGEFASTFKAR